MVYKMNFFISTPDLPADILSLPSTIIFSNMADDKIIELLERVICWKPKISPTGGLGNVEICYREEKPDAKVLPFEVNLMPCTTNGLRFFADPKSAEHVKRTPTNPKHVSTTAAGWALCGRGAQLCCNFGEINDENVEKFKIIHAKLGVMLCNLMIKHFTNRPKYSDRIIVTVPRGSNPATYNSNMDKCLAEFEPEAILAMPKIKQSKMHTMYTSPKPDKVYKSITSYMPLIDYRPLDVAKAIELSKDTQRFSGCATPVLAAAYAEDESGHQVFDDAGQPVVEVKATPYFKFFPIIFPNEAYQNVYTGVPTAKFELMLHPQVAFRVMISKFEVTNITPAAAFQKEVKPMFALKPVSAKLLSTPAPIIVDTPPATKAGAKKPQRAGGRLDDAFADDGFVDDSDAFVDVPAAKTPSPPANDQAPPPAAPAPKPVSSLQARMLASRPVQRPVVEATDPDFN
jgi:hypothetical protein